MHCKPPCPQRAEAVQSGFQPGTGSKLLNMVVVQMATEMHCGRVQEFLDLFQSSLVTFSKAVLATPDPAATLAEVAGLCSRASAPPVFERVSSDLVCPP